MLFCRSIEANRLNGDVPSAIWSNITFTGNRSLVLDFQNNSLETIPDGFVPPKSVVLLYVLLYQFVLPAHSYT